MSYIIDDGIMNHSISLARPETTPHHESMLEYSLINYSMN